MCLSLQKGITLKSATSAVRNAYFLCINACFHGKHGDFFGLSNIVLMMVKWMVHVWPSWECSHHHEVNWSLSMEHLCFASVTELWMGDKRMDRERKSIDRGWKSGRNKGEWSKRGERDHPLLQDCFFWRERQKLAWFGHVQRHIRLSKTILQGTLEGGRRRGQQRKCWMDSIKEWTSLPMTELFTRSSCRQDWREDLCWTVPHVPTTTQSVKGLNWSKTVLKPSLIYIYVDEALTKDHRSSKATFAGFLR